MRDGCDPGLDRRSTLAPRRGPRRAGRLRLLRGQSVAGGGRRPDRSASRGRHRVARGNAAPLRRAVRAAGGGGGAGTLADAGRVVSDASPRAHIAPAFLAPPAPAGRIHARPDDVGTRERPRPRWLPRLSDGPTEAGRDRDLRHRLGPSRRSQPRTGQLALQPLCGTAEHARRLRRNRRGQPGALRPGPPCPARRRPLPLTRAVRDRRDGQPLLRGRDRGGRRRAGGARRRTAAGQELRGTPFPGAREAGSPSASLRPGSS